LEGVTHNVTAATVPHNQVQAQPLSQQIAASFQNLLSDFFMAQLAVAVPLFSCINTPDFSTQKTQHPFPPDISFSTLSIRFCCSVLN
jgi:hypothetical protein